MVKTMAIIFSAFSLRALLFHMPSFSAVTLEIMIKGPVFGSFSVALSALSGNAGSILFTWSDQFFSLYQNNLAFNLWLWWHRG